MDYDNDNNSNNLYKGFGIIIIFIFFIYSVLTLKYVFNQLCSSKKRFHFMVYWIDLLYMLLIFLFFSFIFTFYVYDEKNDSKNLNKFEICLPIILSGNFLMNIFISLSLINLILKLLNIQIKDMNPIELINFIDKIDVIGIYSIIPHFFKIILILIFEVGTIIIIMKFKNGINNNSINIINLIQVIFCLIQFILMKILFSKYKKLKTKNLYSNNISNEKIYNITKQKLIIISEHLINKSIYDIILNIPTIIKFSIEKSDSKEKFSYLMDYIFEIFFAYIYFILLGSMLLRTDKNNKIPVPKLMRFLYYLHWFKIIMGLKNNNVKLFKPILIDNRKNSVLENFNSDDDTYLNEKEEHLFHAIIENNLNLNLNDNENNNNLKKDFKISEFLKKSILEKIIYESEKEYLPCNFFIIYKLLFLFYKSNLNVYRKVEKLIEEEGIPFQKSIKKENEINLLRERVSRLSRISIDNREKIIPFKKFELKQLMNSIDDKIIKEDFIKFIINDNNKKDKESNNSKNEYNENRNRSINSITKINYDEYEFLIESLLTEILFELYPFYQISINDILNSLEIGYNKELLNLFFENKMKDNNFNVYYTKDSFLSFEIYDNTSIQYSQLKNFILNYKTYLIDKISNFNYSFLPLILGIFNIKYVNYNKIIILYRNPLAFTPFINFNYWINFTFNDGNEIKNISTTNTDILDINEIEVKNNIILNDDDYNNTVNILKNDMKFLRTQNLELNFNLNLIVVNDVKKNNNNISLDSSALSFENENNKNGNFNQDNNNNVNLNNDFDKILRETNLFRESILNNVKKLKKYFGSDVVSLLEKLYINNVVDNQYIFKIYFTEIFKKKNRIISKDNEFNLDNSNSILNPISLDENEIKENNKKYCNYVKSKLLRKIRRDNNSFLDSSDNKFQITIKESE